MRTTIRVWCAFTTPWNSWFMSARWHRRTWTRGTSGSWIGCPNCTGCWMTHCAAQNRCCPTQHVLLTTVTRHTFDWTFQFSVTWSRFNSRWTSIVKCSTYIRKTRCDWTKYWPKTNTCESPSQPLPNRSKNCECITKTCSKKWTICATSNATATDSQCKRQHKCYGSCLTLLTRTGKKHGRLVVLIWLYPKKTPKRTKWMISFVHSWCIANVTHRRTAMLHRRCWRCMLCTTTMKRWNRISCPYDEWIQTTAVTETVLKPHA